MPKNIKTINKPKLVWVNFLHIYQPPWQSAGIFEKAANQSYDYLLSLLEKYPNWQITLNVTGNLLEMLATQRPDLLARLRKLVKAQRVELTASAYYHPILPLLPESEIVRQIELNQQSLKKYFGEIKIKGFYLPEMAYSFKVAKIIKKLGYQWLILDSIHYKSNVDNNILYSLNKVGIHLLFRDRTVSTSYPPEIIYKRLAKLKKDELIITATDGELYGHFHTDWQGYIERVLLAKNVVSLKVSEYLESLVVKESIDLRPAAWESSLADIKKNIPYLFWNDPKNIIHHDLWLLANLAIKLVNKYSDDQNYFWARQHLDKALSSCTWWWAADKKPSAFSEITWHPDMIDHGLEELVRSIRSLSRATRLEKISAEKIYLRLKQAVWFKHWHKN